MRCIVVAALVVVSATAAADHAFAQVGFTSDVAISWEVKSRFRLFRYESDFLKHVDAERGDGILGAEQRLAREDAVAALGIDVRSEEHTSELQSQSNLVCRLLLEKKNLLAVEPRPLTVDCL